MITLYLTSPANMHYAGGKCLKPRVTSGMSPRQSVAFFTPVSFSMGAARQKYETRKGNTANSACYEVSTLAPTPLFETGVVGSFQSQQGATMSTQGQGTSVPVVFNFNSTDVRTVIRDGAVWFVAADVCAALGYSNSRKVVADHLDDDERCNESLQRGGEHTIISESGLYALVLRSHKPAARQFAKWVTSEVLPSIRKTGSYQSKNQSNAKLDASMLQQIEQRAWVLAQDDYKRHCVAMRAACNADQTGRFNAASWSPIETNQAIVNELEAAWYVLHAMSVSVRAKQAKLADLMGIALPIDSGVH